MQKSREILKQVWGYEEFRPMQEDIVDAAINGNDVLALLPTGGGKSICFQVPGLAREGLCLVISPLIALMQDQVDQLVKRGVRAKAIISGMSYKDIDITLDNARFGGLDFLYLSPERLKTDIFLERFKLMKPGLIVIDEAHCISEWGHDFRPPYREIAALRQIHPQVPFMALTATATDRVKKDIVEQLQLKKTQRFEADFSRPNISYEVYPVENKLFSIKKQLGNFKGQTGIIYCQTRKSVKDIAKLLLADGHKVGIYHGGLDKLTREKMMLSWLKNETLIMIATNAFGMGIDKPDVRFVFHYEFPNNPEAYFQEAGRAGRDGRESRTMVFYEKTDLSEMDELVRKQFPDMELVKLTYRALCNYLKIAIGSGQGESYPLDIKLFCKTFRLNILEVYQALKLLEMNGTLLFSEDFFHPTKVRFNVNNTTLYSFQLAHDSIYPLTSFLSRTYSGIFDYYFAINEEECCKRLKITQKELERQLKFLEQSGIIDIEWKTELPMVTFIQERLPDSYLNLNPDVYRHRKEVLEERWNCMRTFLSGSTCRSQFLISYFGQKSEECGKCDVCLEKNKPKSSELKDRLLSFLSNKKTISDVTAHFSSVPEKQIKALIKELMLQELIHQEDGKLKTV